METREKVILVVQLAVISLTRRSAFTQPLANCLILGTCRQQRVEDGAIFKVHLRVPVRV